MSIEGLEHIVGVQSGCVQEQRRTTAAPPAGAAHYGTTAGGQVQL